MGRGDRYQMAFEAAHCTNIPALIVRAVLEGRASDIDMCVRLQHK